MTETTGGPGRVRVWDVPVRLSHWLLVVLLAFSWWSAGENLQWHRWSGYAILGIVLFRLYWGFAARGPARFANFLRGPKATLVYMRSLGERAPSGKGGHNPLGAWSVVALLLVVLAQVIFGLFAVDVDGFESGPLSYMVDFETGRAFAELHDQTFRVLQVLVGLHVAAVLFYLAYKRTNLIAPMLTGRQWLTTDPGPIATPLWRLALGLALAGAATWFVAKGLQL